VSNNNHHLNLNKKKYSVVSISAVATAAALRKPNCRTNYSVDWTSRDALVKTSQWVTLIKQQPTMDSSSTIRVKELIQIFISWIFTRTTMVVGKYPLVNQERTSWLMEANYVTGGIRSQLKMII